MAKRDKSEPETSEKQKPSDASVERSGEETEELAPKELKGLLEIVTDTYEMNREQLTELVDGVKEYTRQRPFKSVLLAAGAGMLLGAIFG